MVMTPLLLHQPTSRRQVNHAASGGWTQGKSPVRAEHVAIRRRLGSPPSIAANSLINVANATVSQTDLHPAGVRRLSHHDAAHRRIEIGARWEQLNLKFA